MATSYTDRDLSSPWQVGPDLYSYPFADLGNTTTRTITRRYWVKPGSWSPSALGTSGTKITVDAVDYYLLEETGPSVTATGLFMFTRLYVPEITAQTQGTSTNFTTPNLSPTSIGSLTTFDTDYVVPAGVAQRVGDYGYIALTELAPITGYYDEQKTVTWGSPNTCTAHGLSVNDVVIYRNGNVSGSAASPYNYATVATVPTADTFTITGATVIGSAATSGWTSRGATVAGVLLTADNQLRRMTKLGTDSGDTLNITARSITAFYLPGITAGITDYTDIEPESPFGLTNYLAAWAGAADWFPISAEPVRPWRGPMLAQTYTQAEIADLA